MYIPRDAEYNSHIIDVSYIRKPNKLNKLKKLNRLNEPCMAFLDYIYRR